MIICGNFMFEFNVSKDMQKNYMEGSNKDGSITFMSNTNCQGIENQC